MKTRRNERRSRRVYVDTKVQGVLARRVILHFVMFIMIGAAVGMFLQFLSDPLMPLAHHANLFWTQCGPYVIAMLCMLPVFIKDTLQLTHRMAGPIVRLRSVIRDLATGRETAPLKFRKGDFFDDLPPLFNDMVAQLRNESAPDIDAVLQRAEEVCGSAEDSVDPEAQLAAPAAAVPAGS